LHAADQLSGAGVDLGGEMLLLLYAEDLAL